MTLPLRLSMLVVAVPLAAACGGGAAPPQAAAPEPAPAAVQPAAPAAPEPAAVPSPVEPPPAAAPAKKTGGHAHHAPHGGSLVEFGDEFAHLEFVLDAATGRLTAYALDGEAERPVRLAQPTIDLTLQVPGAAQPLAVSLAGVANALTGEQVGDTSQFRAEVPDLKGHKQFSGTIAAVTLRGQAFTRVAFEFPSTGH